MKSPFVQRLDLFTRNSMPVLLTLILVLINFIPLQIPGLSRVVPVLPLMAIYHWAIYRPQLMPPLAVFIIGAFYDVLSGTPIGVNALVFLIVYGVVLLQQRFFVGKSFIVVWLGFGLIAMGASVISWILISILTTTLIDMSAVLFQLVLNFSFFPIVAWLFLVCQNSFLKLE
jgi:rod shape-determining protein MreD